jgi:ABC-2 type transport system permease protein
MAAYALTQATIWASDLDAGRLELPLSTPQPRWRVYVEAWAALLAALVLAPLAVWLVALVTLQGFGLNVPGDRLFLAFLGFLPFQLLIAAFVYLVAGHLTSGAITGIAGGMIGISFLGQLLGTTLNLPEWLLQLSIFYQYGSPLLDGPRWGAWFAMLALAVVLAALGLAQFTRSDLQRAA